MFNLNVVLMGTVYSSNVGAATRAAANMGADRFILVEKKCEIDSKARQGAAGAQDLLHNRIEYDTLDEFLKSEIGLYIGMSRRSGKYRTPLDLKDSLNTIESDRKNGENIYFIFGAEDDGLPTTALDKFHLTCSLPTHGEFQSLNLAQSVLLTLFIAREKWPIKSHLREIDPEQLGLSEELDSLIKKWLLSMGFNLSHRQGSAYKVTRKLLLQGLPHLFELKIFNAILKQNIQLLNKAQAASTTKELTDRST